MELLQGGELIHPSDREVKKLLEEGGAVAQPSGRADQVSKSVGTYPMVALMSR